MATTTSITTTYAGEFAGDYIAAALLVVESFLLKLRYLCW